MTTHSGVSGPEPTPWWSGILVSVLVAGLMTTAVFGFGVALARINPVLAAIVNVVAVGGAAPSIWRWRTIAVVRWIVFGVIAGVALGWLGLLVYAL